MAEAVRDRIEEEGFLFFVVVCFFFWGVCVGGYWKQMKHKTRREKDEMRGGEGGEGAEGRV